MLAGAAAATFAGFALAAPAAGAAPLHSGPPGDGASHVVFVQTDNLAGNQIAAYSRARDGSLALAGTYDAGGLGGQLTGSMVDHLASQGSLAYVPASSSLVAVNAGDQRSVVLLPPTGRQPDTARYCRYGPGRYLLDRAARGHFYASNAGMASVTGYDSARSGELTSLGNTCTDPGTVDASASAGGHFLYVQTGGNGVVDGYRVHADGSLTPAGTVTVAGAAGGEGIVAF